MILFSVGVVIATLPKKNLYYLLEHHLSNQDIIISNEDISSHPLSFSISNADIIYKDIPAGMLQQLRLNLYPHQISLTLNKFIMNDSIKNILPANIDSLQLRYSILAPSKITIEGKTDFGTIEGDFRLFDQTLSLVLYPVDYLTPNQKNVLKFMQYHQGNEESPRRYTYEYTY